MQSSGKDSPSFKLNQAGTQGFVNVRYKHSPPQQSQRCCHPAQPERERGGCKGTHSASLPDRGTCRYTRAGADPASTQHRYNPARGETMQIHRRTRRTLLTKVRTSRVCSYAQRARERVSWEGELPAPRGAAVVPSG